MGKLVEKQVIVNWYKPEERMPEEHYFVVACISFKSETVTYDHAMVIANWADDGDDWIFDDPLANRYKDRVTVHAWADLEPYGGD